MKKIIVIVVVTLAVLMVGSLIFIESGVYDISQLTPHNAVTKWAINTTRKKSIEKRMMDVKVPDLSDTSLIIEGFVHYNNMCTICHGAPGVEPDEMTKGLYPKPPVIYKHDDLEPNEAFWIIKKGIKMTSMPAYAPSHTDDKIWALTAFVTKKLGTITPQEYSEWVKKYAGRKTD